MYIYICKVIYIKIYIYIYVKFGWMDLRVFQACKLRGDEYDSFISALSFVIRSLYTETGEPISLAWTSSVDLDA